MKTSPLSGSSNLRSSASNASTIWLDITTIYGWTTTAVGIVRMEMECATYAIEHLGSEVRFCRFDENQGYLVIEREQVIALLDRLQCQVKSRDFVQPAAADALSVRVAGLKRRIKRSLGRLPPSLSITIWSFGTKRKTALRAFLRAYRDICLAIQESIRPSIRPNDFASIVRTVRPYEVIRAPFEKSDVYLSMGLDWDHKDLPYLFGQKKQIGFKVVLFCYDIIPILLPHLCVGNVAAFFAKYFADVAWCADDVFCISEHSKKDLRRFLKSIDAPVPSMQVVRLGASLSSTVSTPIDPTILALARMPYLLFVSTIERRKNHEVLYRAYLQLIEAGMTKLPRLVFVGKLGWGVNDFLADVKFDQRIQGYITILHYVTDAELKYLYQHADFTLFPSLYEGWGLPVAESLMSGKFCLASNRSSVPEVGQGFIQYIDPWDINAWAQQIAYFVAHPEEVKLREAKITAQYQATTWQQASEQIFSRVSDLLN